jgi:hypothetical protein
MEKAIAVLNKSLTALPEKNAPYDQPQILAQTAQLLFMAGEEIAATKLAERVFVLDKQILDYYKSLDPARKKNIKVKSELEWALLTMEQLVKQLEEYIPESEAAKTMRATFEATLNEMGILEKMKKERLLREMELKEEQNRQLKEFEKKRDSITETKVPKKNDTLTGIRK